MGGRLGLPHQGATGHLNSLIRVAVRFFSGVLHPPLLTAARIILESFVTASHCELRSVVIASAFGDEFADGFVAGDVIAGTATGAAWRESAACNDDGARTALAGGG